MRGNVTLADLLVDCSSSDGNSDHVADGFDDIGEADGAAAGVNQVAERFLGEFQADRLLVRFAGGSQPIEGAGQVAGVAFELAGEPGEHVVGNRQCHSTGDLLQDAQAGCKIGGLERADQAAGEPGDDLGAEAAQLGERAVSREDQLLAAAEERVDRVDQFDERRLLAAEELHVVDQQHFDVADFAAEVRRAGVANGVEELIGELLGGKIDHAAQVVRVADVPPDAFEQVRLAAAGRADERQRRIGAGARGGGLGRGECDAVWVAGEEVGEVGELAAGGREGAGGGGGGRGV